MNLSESLDTVTISDIKWAIKHNYETDIKWVALNLTSLLSNNNRRLVNNREFKKIVLHSFYSSNSSPVCDWSGWYPDLIELTTILTGEPFTRVKSVVNSLTHDEESHINIRLRNFQRVKKPLFGQSKHLKIDEKGNYYTWMYDSNKVLVQVPEQTLKEQLIIWESHIAGDVL